MHKHLFLPVLASAALSACSSAVPQTTDQARSDVEVRVDIEPWSGELPISAPWLRERLPSGAVAYQRIPHPLGLMAIPKGNALDAALGSQANIQNLVSIQQGLIDNLGVELPPARLLENLRSPIEVAVMAMPSPSALVTATLSLRTNTEFEAFVAELGEHLPVTLTGPLDAEGFGQLAGAPIPIQVRFDEATGRLALFGGLFVDQATFASVIGSANGPSEHPMHLLESQIDASGQGFFTWVDAAQAMQTGAPFIPAEVAARLASSGADQIQALAAGVGVANGKGRLKFLADVGADNPDRRIPVIRNEITATSVGVPAGLGLVSAPSAGEFTRLEALLTAHLPPEGADGWAKARAAFADASGASIEEFLAAVGPELIVVSDRVGDYLALHVRDHALLDSILGRWAEIRGVGIDQRAVGTQTVRYIDVPRVLRLPDAAAEGDSNTFAGLMSQIHNRVYWIVDGDYMYIARTPQVLVDRIGIGADTGIAGWLEDTQRIDVSSSLLAATGSARNLPRIMYNAYISGMQSFADLVGVEYDVWSMPTANQLGLPDRGTLGATVNLGEPYVSLELSYESHPAEILFAAGGATAAVAGIVAAVALPRFRSRIPSPQVTGAASLIGEADATVAATAFEPASE